MTAHASSPADRQIVISRVIDAPPENVWEAFADPKHLAEWWGPNGFTNTFHSFDFREGGIWEFTMHGPDGTDYPNWIRFEKIVPGELIEHLHGENEQHPEKFHASIRFEDQHGKTNVTLRMTLHSAEEKKRLEKFGAVEGGNQTLGRLAEYVTKM